MKRFQVKAAAILFITVIGLGLAGCTDQTADEDAVTKEAFSTEETQQEEMQQEETEAFAEDGHDRVLKESALSWCTSYFKMGNPGYRLVVTPGGRWNRNQLNLEFIKEEDTGGGSVLHSLTFYYEENKRSQHYEDRDGTDDLTAESVPEYDVLLQKDGFVSLTGDSAAAGQYYPEKLLFKPEAFKRPLNASDLLGCTREELRILKNQFYAVYGRKFKSLELQEYFEKQPWYEGTIEGDRFDEAVFCPLEMSNLELLQKAEADFDEKKAAEAKKAYEKLPETPYRGLLPDHGEIQVTIAANGTDQGIFYESEGTISLPVEVLPEQYEAVMKEFGEAEICVNERTGETAVMKISENTDHGDCTLVYDSGLELGYYLSYDPYPGTYSLWANSADTLFKPVYEGSIYVLKGAEKGWSGYFQLPPEERFLEDGGWRKMDFTGEDSGESETYSGNVPAFDEKGYLRGLYYYGD